MTTLVIAAHDIAEDALLPVLHRLGEAHWDHAPHGTNKRLAAAPDKADHLGRVFVAQHADEGAPDPVMGSAGWSGPIDVRCLSADRDLARDGRDDAHAALTSITPPEGYSIHARYVRPIPSFRDEWGVYTRGSRYTVTIRRIT